MAAQSFQGGTDRAASGQLVATPTPDRLAEPTLPADPSQADVGAQLYWLNCMPCHGERGQGLTQEFRQTYPPEDRNCWASGCHGKRPYANGFTLPAMIPPLIGSGALNRFATAADLEGYISTAMPFWKPGSLTDQEYWTIAAFLLRDNGLWQSRGELGPANAERVVISQANDAEPTAAPATEVFSASTLMDLVWLVGGLVLLVLAIFAAFHASRHMRQPKG